MNLFIETHTLLQTATDWHCHNHSKSNYSQNALGFGSIAPDIYFVVDQLEHSEIQTFYGQSPGSSFNMIMLR